MSTLGRHDLEQLLQDNDKYFFELYQDIKSFSESAWQKPLMHWFTDHGPDHSSEIIRYLSLFYKSIGHNILSPIELFILMAAAYVHDVGMQDLRFQGITITTLSEDDYDQVRNNHAIYSKQIIKARGFTNESIPSQEIRISSRVSSDLLEIIGLVSCGHSTSTFYDALREAERKRYDLPGHQIRVDLLIALLLFFDELHIHRGRTHGEKFCTYNPNKYSLYHHYLHYYVRNVDLKYPRVEVIFEYPPDFQSCYTERLIHIVETKLIEQIKRVNNVFSKYRFCIDTQLTRIKQISDSIDKVPSEILKYYAPIDPSTQDLFDKRIRNHKQYKAIDEYIEKLFPAWVQSITYYKIVNSCYRVKDIKQRANDLAAKYLEPYRPLILDGPKSAPIYQNYIMERYIRDHPLGWGKQAAEIKFDESFIYKFQNLLQEWGYKFRAEDIISSPELLLTNDILLGTCWISVIHGDIGVGKTSLLNFVIKHVLSALIQSKYLELRIDPMTRFGKNKISEFTPLDIETAVSESVIKISLEDFKKVEVKCWQEICTNEELRTAMPDVFSKYAEELLNWIENDRAFASRVADIPSAIGIGPQAFNYNLGKLIYLKKLAERNQEEYKRYHHPVLVFDNIDRTDPETQKMAIRIAKQFAKQVDCNVVIAIRNRGFHRLQKQYEKELEDFASHRMIPVQPPRLGEVFRLRVKHAIKNLKEDSSFQYGRVRIRPRKAMDEVVNKFVDLILKDKKSPNKSLEYQISKAEIALSSMYNGNVRASLNTIVDLLCSSEHALPLPRLISELFDILPKGLPPVYAHIAFDTFLELYGLNGCKYYTRDESVLENLYCCGEGEESYGNNILKLRVLKYCYERSNKRRKEIEIEQIFDHFIGLFGYKTFLISSALNQLLSDPRCLLWSKEGSSLREGVTSVEISLAAEYYLSLRNYLWYLCLVKEDTYVPNEVAKRIGFTDFKGRRKKGSPDYYYHNWIHTINFVEYLLFIEFQELINIKSRLQKEGLARYRSVYTDKLLMEETLEYFRSYINKKEQHIFLSLARNDKKRKNRLAHIRGKITMLENKTKRGKQFIYEQKIQGLP
jgi:hypothetical protein